MFTADTFRNASGTRDPYLASGVQNADEGPAAIAVSDEMHHDSFGLVGINRTSAGGPGLNFGATASNTTDTATTAIHSQDSAGWVAAGYDLGWWAGQTTVAAMFEQRRPEQADAPIGPLTNDRRPARQVPLKHRVGEQELPGGATCEASGYGASDIALGYGYCLAATAEVYLHFVHINNSSNGQYTFSIGGSSAVAGATPPGAGRQAIGLGTRYTF